MHGRYKGLLFLLSVFLLWCARCRAEEMMLTVPAKIHPFVECTIRLTLPEDGVLTIGVTDGYGVQKPLAEQQPVQEGQLEIPYDGCSFEGMPAHERNMHFLCGIAGGERHTISDGGCLEDRQSGRCCGVCPAAFTRILYGAEDRVEG